MMFAKLGAVERASELAASATAAHEAYTVISLLKSTSMTKRLSKNATATAD